MGETGLSIERLWPALIVVGILAIALVFMALGWRNRRRRQADLDVVPVPPDEIGELIAEEKLLYVGTSLAEQPMERVVAGSLAFRAKAIVRAAKGGIVLHLTGSPSAFIPVADIRGVGLATWALDRGVEKDGLVFVRWDLGGTLVDSYLRSQNPQNLLDTLSQLSPQPIAADTDARGGDTE